MSRDEEVILDDDLLSLYPKPQKYIFDEDDKDITEPKKDADGAAVAKAFDKFMALIERILN